MFRKVTSSFLRTTLDRAGVSKQVEAFASIEHARTVLKERFGDGVELHAKPQYVKERALTIAVVHPAIAQEIRLCEEAVISAINERIGRPEIVRIHFLLPREERDEDYLPR
jgi:hypothetical protein